MKKEYTAPCITTVLVAAQSIIAYSGGGAGLNIAPDQDITDEPNRVKEDFAFSWE